MYSFFGLFADPVEGLTNRLLFLWPGSSPVLLEEPTSLVGVRFGPELYVAADEDIPDKLSAQIVALSKDYPSTRFMTLRAECFGGVCHHWGYVAQAGLLRHETGEGALRRLVGAFGIDLGVSEIFPPLARDFPWPHH